MSALLPIEAPVESTVRSYARKSKSKGNETFENLVSFSILCFKGNFSENFSDRG
jgi:hypothetical protein